MDARSQCERFDYGLVNADLTQVHYVLESWAVDGVESARGPLREPRPSLYPVSSVYSPDWLLDELVSLDPVLHEDQGPNLQASSDCLQVRSGVSASRPEMLLVGYRFGRDAKDLGQQLMMVADALVHPVNLLGWIVESVSSSHFEDSHVPSTRWSDEFDICIPDAGLADHERIGRRGHRSLSDVRLKVVDRSADKVDIVSPSSHYRVGRNAGMAIVREIIHELNPHLWHGVSSCRRRISDESVRRTGCLSTCRLVRILAPKVAAAVGTFPPCEVLFCKEWNREFFWVDLRHLASLLDFASTE